MDLAQSSEDKVTFYEILASRYDEIFPLSEAQKSFVIQSLGGRTKILDIGCGTGQLCHWLAEQGCTVAGLEPDEAMLHYARKKESVHKVSYYQCGMLDCKSLWKEKSFDGLLCMGNTIPHLASQLELIEFVGQVKYLLSKGGVFCMQLLNYKKIGLSKPGELPEISTDKWLFQRFYSYDFWPKKVGFQVQLTDMANNNKFRSELLLTPFRKDEVESVLLNQGFRVKFYSNFEGSDWSESDDLLVIRAELV